MLLIVEVIFLTIGHELVIVTMVVDFSNAKGLQWYIYCVITMKFISQLDPHNLHSLSISTISTLVYSI